jgi:crossover junction endodeoxyribonuclease RuvC
MRILGVDPGSETTGYGVIESDGTTYQLIECGAIRPPRNRPFAQKLLYIAERLQDVLERLRPEALALEEAFAAINPKSALKLGHVRGVVLLLAARAGLSVYEYSPLEVKSATVGYGRAEKQQVQRMVALLLNLPQTPEPHDVADALAVAICHAHHLGIIWRSSGARRRSS